MKFKIDEQEWLGYSKKEIILKAKEVAENDVELADSDLLTSYMIGKSIIDFLTQYVNNIHEEAAKEFSMYSEKEILKYGRKLSLFESGVKYDFSKCGHPDIEKWESAISRDKEHLDSLKKTIKSFQKKTSLIDDETGEVYEVNPPIKTSTTKLKISY